jgi:hypothetical protein
MSRILRWVSIVIGNPGSRLAILARTFGERFGTRMPQPF